MKRYRRTALSQYLIIALVLAGFVGFGLLGYFVMSQIPFTDHFAIPWAAGRSWLLEGISPYDPSVIGLATSAVEETAFLAQLPEIQVFRQPLLSLLFYLPLSLVPYSISRVIWVLILSVCVGMIGFFSVHLSGLKLSTPGYVSVILFAIFWLPGVNAILGGHFSPIIIALIMAGIYFVVNGQDTTAGLILALTFSSFPTSGMILILLLVWSISHKRWSILSGFFSGIAFLIVLSFLVLPSWFMDWASVMLTYYEGWGWIHTHLMDLASLLPGVADFLSLFLHAVVIIYAMILLITVLGKSDRIFIYKLSAFFILVYFLHIQGSINYLPFLMPAMLLVFRYWADRWRQFGRLISWGFLLVLTAGSWLVVYPEMSFTRSINVTMISIVFPFFVLMGLIWIRWWVLKVPKLPYEAR